MTSAVAVLRGFGARWLELWPRTMATCFAVFWLDALLFRFTYGGTLVTRRDLPSIPLTAISFGAWLLVLTPVPTMAYVTVLAAIPRSWPKPLQRAAAVTASVLVIGLVADVLIRVLLVVVGPLALEPLWALGGAVLCGSLVRLDGAR